MGSHTDRKTHTYYVTIEEVNKNENKTNNGLICLSVSYIYFSSYVPTSYSFSCLHRTTKKYNTIYTRRVFFLRTSHLRYNLIYIA